MRRKKLPEQPEFLTVPDAAKLCGVSRNTVFSWVRQGKIEAYQTPGRTNLIRPTDLLKFMQKSGMFVPPGLPEMAERDELFAKPSSETGIKSGTKSVLVVDDDPIVRKVLAQALADQYTLFQASTGFEALHYLTLRPEISIVLLDHKMPGQVGSETFRELKKLRPDLSVILVLAYLGDIPEDIKTDPIVKRIVEKPFDVNTIREVVRSIADSPGEPVM